MTPLVSRLVIYGLLAIGLVGGYFAWAYHERTLGAAEIRAADAQALAADRGRRLERARQDAKTNEDAVHDLQAELARLAADAAATPAPVIRMCRPQDDRRAAGVPAGIAAPAGQSAAPGGPGSGVREGAEPGPDIGPGVQLLGQVVDQLAAQVRALLERERGLN